MKALMLIMCLAVSSVSAIEKNRNHVFIGSVSNSSLKFIEGEPVVSVEIDSIIEGNYEKNLAYIQLPFDGSPVIERLMEEKAGAQLFFFADMSLLDGIAYYSGILEVMPMRERDSVVEWYKGHLVRKLKESVSSDLRSLNRNHRFHLQLDYTVSGERGSIKPPQKDSIDPQIDAIYLSSIVNTFPVYSDLLSGERFGQTLIFKASKANHYDSKVESILASWKESEMNKNKAQGEKNE